MKHLKTLFLVLISSFTLFSQTQVYKIVGTVYNTNKEVVADWPVAIIDASGIAVKLQTDPNGNYEYKFELNQNRLQVYQIQVVDPCQPQPLIQKAVAKVGEERFDFVICAKNTSGGSPCDGKFTFTVNQDGWTEFHVTTLYSDAKYYWDFGDGQSGEGADIKHQYGRPGTYEVTLVIATSTCKSRVSLKVDVKFPVPPNPTTNWTNNCCGKVNISSIPNPSGSSPNSFIFNAGFDFKATDIRWDFGDGTGESGVDVKHTYAREGKYLVTTTIKGELCTVILNTWIHVNGVVTPPNPCNIDFLFSTDNLSAKFQADLKGAKADKISWDFGDGSNASDLVTSHTYAKEGEYKVTLYASINGVVCQITKVIKVGTRVNPNPCNIDFNFATDNLSAKFQADLKGSKADKISWDFGDGSFSSDLNTSHTYKDAGEYKVTLYVSINGTVCQITKLVKVGSRVNPNPCNVDFKFSVNNLTVKFQADFKNARPDRVYWEFGDGTNSTDLNPVHTFGKIGEYTITLKVSINGAVCTITKVIKVGTRISTPGNSLIVIYDVSPNPAIEDIMVSVKSNIKASTTLVIADLSNNNLVKAAASLEIGDNKIPMAVKDLKAGTYVVYLYYNNKIVSRYKFEKI
ncbi:MAG: PKD domain-containing protein [Saprospiraceae bacterium]|nr:PKD domain-containing protein [Saprospiraceae bacterium]MBK7736376.1 PKD domain-containing protein [Saprospiraceae bacterium]MBK7912259.1 PKD domain-containing protein [Saprospiraceae bacterium]